MHTDVAQCVLCGAEAPLTQKIAERWHPYTWLQRSDGSYIELGIVCDQHDADLVYDPENSNYIVSHKRS